MMTGTIRPKTHFPVSFCLLGSVKILLGFEITLCKSLWSIFFKLDFITRWWCFSFVVLFKNKIWKDLSSTWEIGWIWILLLQQMQCLWSISVWLALPWCMDLADKVARPVSTAIYFLLPTGAVSRLHRIPCAEVWHFYAGEPLTVSLFWHPNSMSFFHNQLQPIFLGKMEVPSCRFDDESWLFPLFFHRDFCALCLSFFLVFTSHECDSLFLQL